MIRHVVFKNFKSLKSVALSTAPLTLLSGLNGIGKSSFVQAILLLRQLKTEALLLNGEWMPVRVGKDLIYKSAEDDDVVLSFETADGKAADIRITVATENQNSDDLPWTHAPGNAHETVTALAARLRYLSADRLAPQARHQKSLSNLRMSNLGIHGEFAIHYLFANSAVKVKRSVALPDVDLSLLSQVNAWLGKISPGVRAEISEREIDLTLAFSYLRENGEYTDSFMPENVGFGLSCVLPVVVALLVPDDNILLVENPESNVHPRGQAELGRLMALSATAGKQVFVETHSDHIINGVCVAVKEKLISRQDIKIAFFEKINKNGEQYADIREIGVDQNGTLSDYPADFMDEWNNQLGKLV
jgi:predicted ATPase